MLSWEQIKNPQLDIVGIVAVLGEGSTIRSAQASALGWHHILPRLLPAPQALLKHEREKRLPTVPGTVVGAYSGKIKFELNFFCQLLHPDDLRPYQVEVVEVTYKTKSSIYTRIQDWLRKPPQKQELPEEGENDQDTTPSSVPGAQAYGIRPYCSLVLLSLLGFFLSVGMLVGSVVYRDGFALLATLLLSLTSFLVGLASSWKLDFKEHRSEDEPQKHRRKAIPDSDVVLYYPRQGAFRIIRCNESISNLYFQTETCQYTFGDDPYRFLALLASFCLMVGLICMSNSRVEMQVAFAVSYIFLNAISWAFSAINPVSRKWGHWTHRYKRTTISIVTQSGEPSKGDPVPIDTRKSSQETSTETKFNAISTSRDTYQRHDFSVDSKREPPHKDDDVPRVVPQISQRYDSNLDLNTHVRPIPSLSDSPVEITAGIAFSPAHKTSPVAVQSERQNTKDVEGLRWRFRKPWGSAKDKTRGLLSKRPQGSSTKEQIESSESFTSALWKAIAVTGSTGWLKRTHIAPDNEVWRAWIEMAERKAATQFSTQGERVAACKVDDQGRIQLPYWDYDGALTDLFENETDLRKRRPPLPSMSK